MQLAQIGVQAGDQLMSYSELEYKAYISSKLFFLLP